MKTRTTLLIITSLLASLFISKVSYADNNWYYYQKPSERTYKVSITNITKGIRFTPVLAATHSKDISFFTTGEAASPELALLAEGGATDPLKAVLDGVDSVFATTTTAGLLQPGDNVELEITSQRQFSRLSFAAMLLPTNDSFVSLNSVLLPRRGTATYFARGYDAGSEPNDELCVNIPGPTCGGAGPSPEEGGEGYVFISPGIHGEADLARSSHDWRDAVARVVITRIR